MMEAVMNFRTEATQFFWEESFLADAETSIGRLMGFPCLPTSCAFFATCDHRSGDLVVKLPAVRVTELIASGARQPFARAGRTFKECVSIPNRDADRWEAIVHEARNFVASTVPARR